MNLTYNRIGKAYGGIEGSLQVSLITWLAVFIQLTEAEQEQAGILSQAGGYMKVGHRPQIAVMRRYEGEMK